MKVAERSELPSTRHVATDRARPSSPRQRQVDASAVVQRLRDVQGLADRSAVVQRPGGLEGLRDAVSRLSGQDLRDVEIHRDSPLPARKGALAFATRDAVHLGSGLEGAAGHELWHVAQQRAGRVRATDHLGDGTAINADAGLEREADTMGARAGTLAREAAAHAPAGPSGARASASAGPEIVQGLWTRAQARALVSNDRKGRSDAYKSILDEFQHWHEYVVHESAAVKQEFLRQLLRNIDEYLGAKIARGVMHLSADRRKTIHGMYQLRAHITTELGQLVGVVAPGERVYVGGGQQALDEDQQLRNGLRSGVFAGKTAVMPGTDGALAGLAAGSTIHAFGHGNYGAAIGSKSYNLDPAQLVDSLIADGLPSDRPVVLRLFACGTGASTQRGGHYRRNSTAFVQRVAERLARRGFEHATVVGYTVFGIPAAYADAPLGKGRAVYHPEDKIHSKASNIHDVTGREVVWVVRNGQARKNSGGNWVASNPRGERYEIQVA